MIKFKKNISDNEFLDMLKLLDEDYLIIAMGTVAPELTIEKTNDFVDSYKNDIPTLLEHQSNLSVNITDYKYIKTGVYYNQTSVADTVFKLFDKFVWLWFKEELMEYFTE